MRAKMLAFCRARDAGNLQRRLRQFKTLALNGRQASIEGVIGSLRDVIVL